MAHPVHHTLEVGAAREKPRRVRVEETIVEVSKKDSPTGNG